MNNSMYMAMTFALWLEVYDFSHIIVYFVKVFFTKEVFREFFLEVSTPKRIT
jgi:hypothetical protein